MSRVYEAQVRGHACCDDFPLGGPPLEGRSFGARRITHPIEAREMSTVAFLQTFRDALALAPYRTSFFRNEKQKFLAFFVLPLIVKNIGGKLPPVPTRSPIPLMDRRQLQKPFDQ